MEGSRCLLMVVILCLSTDSVQCAASFISPESVNLNVYAQYTCTVSNGSRFLRWRFGEVGNSFLFSISDRVGFTSTLPDHVFFATVTNTTNGLASILSFYVTNELSGTQIICEDPENSHSVSLNVTIRDPPSTPDVTLSCISSTCFNVQWTDLSECFLISRYEVSLSNGEMKTVVSSGTDVSFCFSGDVTTFDITDVTVVAFDNADREGESTVVEIPGDIDIDNNDCFTRICDISLSEIFRYCQLNENFSSIVVIWENSCPDVKFYYTINGEDILSNITEDTFLCIKNIPPNSNVSVNLEAMDGSGNITNTTEEINDECVIFPPSDMNNTCNDPDDYSCGRGCLIAISITFGCTTGGVITVNVAQLIIYIVKRPKDVNKINNGTGKPDSPEPDATSQDIEMDTKPKE